MEGPQNNQAAFDPSDPKYKRVEDLPESERDKYVNVDGGFVRREAMEYEEDIETAAENSAPRTTEVRHASRMARRMGLPRSIEVPISEVERAKRIAEIKDEIMVSRARRTDSHINAATARMNSAADAIIMQEKYGGGLEYNKGEIQRAKERSEELKNE